MAKSILIVEDNRQDEILILRALKRSNLDCRLDVVRDGQQALDYLLCEGEFGERGQTLPSVIFLDLSLPRVGGLEVLAQLRAKPQTRLLPICVLTSSDEERDRQKAYANGASDYVCKPLDFQVFAATIFRLAQQWLATEAVTMDLATRPLDTFRPESLEGLPQRVSTSSALTEITVLHRAGLIDQENAS